MLQFKTIKTLATILLCIVLIATACKKTEGNGVSNNTAPKANAGKWDLGLILPENQITLSGTAFDVENNITSYSWKKISGPQSCIIANSNLLTTTVKDLEKGDYEFELTVTDKGNLSAKDSIRVQVVDSPPSPQEPKELIFKNVTWGCPMGCYSLVNCLRCYVPVGITFTLFIKKQNAVDWVQVYPEIPPLSLDKYYYMIYNGNIEIHSFYDETYTIMDVKLRY